MMLRILILLLVLVPSRPASDHGKTNAILLREKIPVAPGVSYTHPSDVCQLQDGTLAIICNGGPKEASPENKIWITRQPPKGTWTPPVPLDPNPEGKPLDVGIIFQPKRPKAPVLCYFWFGFQGERPHNETPCIRESLDGGKTWGPRLKGPNSPGGEPWAQYENGGTMSGPLQCAPVELPDGTLIAGGHLQQKGAKDIRAPIVRIPPDNYTGNQPGGAKWEVLDVRPGTGLPGFLILSPDRKHLALIGRGSLDGPHNISESKDTGKTWSKAVMLPKCGGAGVGCVSLDIDGGPAQGWHVVAGSGGAPGRRNGLTVAISKTPLDPASWIKALILHVDEGGEDADPTLIQTDDRKVHLVFTGRSQNGGIRHYVLDPDKLIQATEDANPAAK
jgi:hypothetical protein